MSYCEIVLFREGKACDGIEYKNSWGGAARIWTSLFDKYLKNPAAEYDTWLLRPEALWALADRKDLPLFERAVLASTFDWAIVRNANFKKFAGHLREFVAQYPPGKAVCHLGAWADFIEACKIEAIGFYGTSVVKNPWFVGEFVGDRYDLNSGEKHFEIYEDLEERK